MLGAALTALAALCAAEDVEEILIGEDFLEVRDGAVLGDADLGAVFELDSCFLGAVGELKGPMIEDGVFDVLPFHEVAKTGEGPGFLCFLCFCAFLAGARVVTILVMRFLFLPLR